nr:STM4012 family radical SAM protein [Micromonospora sp. DSM 115978]
MTSLAGSPYEDYLDGSPYEDYLDGSPYRDYLYAYPHKTAYRPLRPRSSLREVWAEERRDALFCYLHVPFCEMRCGFCNLFTRANPPAEQVDAYLAQLRRQADRVRDALGAGADFARVAIGGGTPTFLTAGELSALFDLLSRFGVRPGAVPLAVETSPATATADRIAVLAERGTSRISIGVQSFLDTEARAVGRPQRRVEVETALETIRSVPGPALNIDLIYGIPGQTARTWQASLSAALRWRPEELYLYPLYVRPLTGLRRRRPAGGGDREWDGQRRELYRLGRRTLLAAGYRQLSMRHFRHADPPGGAAAYSCRVGGVADYSCRVGGVADYSCQDDGMVGLGCGARSYTAGLHYSFDYAVGVGQVRAIIDDYLRRPAADFDRAEVGFRLDGPERRRRWLVTSLLRAEGFRPADYRIRHGTAVEADFPELAELTGRGWLEAGPDRVRLTEAGLERSDAIGPWLVSRAVRAAMTEYAAR